MEQTAHDATLREVVQMLARFAETCAAHENRADSKFAVNKMIERDTARRDVAAGIRSGEFDPEPLPRSIDYAAEERLDGLDLDQRDVALAMARRLGIEPGPGEIPIALQPASPRRPKTPTGTGSGSWVTGESIAWRNFALFLQREATNRCRPVQGENSGSH